MNKSKRSNLNDMNFRIRYSKSKKDSKIIHLKSNKPNVIDQGKIISPASNAVSPNYRKHFQNSKQCPIF